jgi:hypothetical protein
MSQTATHSGDLRERLKETQAAVRSARTEQAAIRRTFDRARADVAKLNCPPAEMTATPAWRAAERAKDELSSAEEKLEKSKEAEVGLLQMLGQSQPVGLGLNGPRPSDVPPGDGFALAARELNLATGRTRIDFSARDLMRSPLASISVTPSELHSPSIESPFLPKPADRRLLYPVFPQAPVESGDLALTEYRQIARAVEGDIERDPMSTDEKATLALAIELVTPSLRQFAVVADKVPSKLFEAIGAFYSFLQQELRLQLDYAIDEHVIAQLLAATPAHGKTGATLIERVRNGLAVMREGGANPTVLALSPSDSAALDTQKSTGSADYIFATRSTGSASPLYGLTIIESPKVTAPVILDPALCGVLYSQMGAILVDPYTGMSQNLISVRVELDAYFHVRSAAGAYLIE